MKLKSILSITFTIIIYASLLGQKPHLDPKYGADSASRMECLKNLSLYREFVKQNNIKDAISPWTKVFYDCPAASKNIYLDGVKIYRFLIEGESDVNKQTALVDSLMKVYDQRIKYYKEEGFVLGRKGVDFLRYRKDNIEDVKTGYDILLKSISLQKNKSEEAVLVTYMTASETLYKGNVIKNDQVIEDYALLSDIIDSKLAKDNNDEKAIQARDNIDAVFERAGAATCEALNNLFKPKFETTPNDIGLLEKITNLLDKTNCKEDDLFFNASENLHNLKPTSKSASMVAEMCGKREKNEKAIKYYLQAISLEEDNIVKSVIYLQLASIYRKLEKFPEARDYALKALEVNPSAGEAYLIIGHLYAASSSCGVDDLTKAAIYWVAVDKYIQAKSVKPELTEESDRYIETYKKYFPSKETIFFFSLNEGDTYRVGCWINENTTVRINN